MQLWLSVRDRQSDNLEPEAFVASSNVDPLYDFLRDDPRFKEIFTG
jgi:hypothetical protein